MKIVLLFALVISLFSCSKNKADNVSSFNILYCKKIPLGLTYNNSNVIEHEKMLYSKKMEGSYINGELQTLELYKSDGIISYTNKDLKVDSLLARYIDIPLRREIIIHSKTISDNKSVFVYEKKRDSIFVKRNDEIIIYNNIKLK